MKDNDRPKLSLYVKPVPYRFRHLTKKEINELEQWSKKDIAQAIDLLLKKIYEMEKRDDVKKGNYENKVMTIEYNDGTVDQYKGSVTVWHKMPLMKRCSISEESWPCDIWTYIDHYGNDYPTAHKKPS